MRCRNCDYRLWNLQSRKCPECGAPFLPSEYEFVPNSVKFRCPHCDQVYYGTGERGHLEPEVFDCVSCSAHIHMDEMVLLPETGVEEEETQAEHAPWLDRRRRGTFRAWLSTVGMALTAPGKLMRLTPVASPAGEAWKFAVLSHVLVVSIGALPAALFFGFVGLAGGGGPFPAVAAMGIGVCGSWCGAIVGVLILVAVEGLITHGLLRLTGKTAAGIGRTYHAVCYSSGANVVATIPCIGWYLGWMWWPVSAVIMVREAQQVRALRAALAVLALPVLILAGIATFYIWLFTSVMPMMIAGPGGLGASLMADTQTVVDGMLDYANEHSGRGPDHAIQLVAEDFVASFELVVFGTMTDEDDVPLGDTSLDRFDFLTEKQRKPLIRKMVNALPDNVIAHRVGDFVFTHHQMDLRTADARLWVVVRWPDPDVNPATTPGRSIMTVSASQAGATTVSQVSGPSFSVGLADGSVVSYPVGSIAALLAAQNAVRAAQGLAPLASACSAPSLEASPTCLKAGRKHLGVPVSHQPPSRSPSVHG